MPAEARGNCPRFCTKVTLQKNNSRRARSQVPAPLLRDYFPRPTNGFQVCLRDLLLGDVESVSDFGALTPVAILLGQHQIVQRTQAAWHPEQRGLDFAVDRHA